MKQREGQPQRPGQQYPDEVKEEAFLLWATYRSFRDVAKQKGMPSVGTLVKWSKDYNWEEKLKKTQQVVRVTELANQVPTSPQIQQMQKELLLEVANFKELVKMETGKLKLVKMWLQYIMNSISRSLVEEAESLKKIMRSTESNAYGQPLDDKGEVIELKKSPFMPSDAKEAIKVLQFLSTEERQIRGVMAFPEMQVGAGSTSEIDDKLDQIANDDKLLGVLSGLYKQLDVKDEQNKLSGVFDFKSEP